MVCQVCKDQLSNCSDSIVEQCNSEATRFVTVFSIFSVCVVVFFGVVIFIERRLCAVYRRDAERVPIEETSV